MDKSLICIRCPIGCSLNVTIENGVITNVTGNECKRGIDYAHKELISPTRSVSSTIPITGGDIDILPVRTSTDVPKESIFAIMEEIQTLHAQAPIKVGATIKDNIAGTGANLISTRTVVKK